jgi:hypothetical protein
LSDFHSSKEWIALSKKHKALERANGLWRCVGCGYKGELESDHILPVSKYPMLGLWLCNLALRCGPCNKKKGTKFYVSPRSLLLLGVYYSVKIPVRILLIACLLFVGHIVYLDLRAGPFDTTFFYQTYVAFYQLYVDSISLTRFFQ